MQNPVVEVRVRGDRFGGDERLSIAEFLSGRTLPYFLAPCGPVPPMTILNAVLARGSWGSMGERVEWDPFNVTPAGYQVVVEQLLAMRDLDLVRLDAPAWVETLDDFTFWSVEVNQDVPALDHRELDRRERELGEQLDAATDRDDLAAIELERLRVQQERMRMWGQPRHPRWRGSAHPRQPRDLTGHVFAAPAPESRLAGACLDRADATNANLRRSDLSNATFRNALLLRADLMQCDLRGADLSGALHLDTALLAEALYSGETRFPDGFDPKAHGMLLREAARFSVPALAEWVDTMRS